MFCLIRPPGVETFRIGTLTLAPPLGAAYIAGALEAHGYPVHVIDAVAAAPTRRTAYFRGHLIGLELEEIARRVPTGTRVIGITCIFTHEWPMVVRLTELLRARFADAVVVIGGEHVTSLPEFSLATSEADVLVLGEGEETIVQLMKAIDDGGAFEGIAGIAYRKENAIAINPRRPRTIALGEIARPAWHLFDLGTYHRHRFVGGVYSTRLTVPILATRGCPYQCTFCSAPNMWTTRWVAREPDDVVDEIESYVRDYGAGNFPFQDLTAVMKRDWIVRFCREIIDRGLDVTWQLANGTRSEAIDGEVAELLKRSGMISAAYAPESGSDTTRAFIKKRVQRDRLMASIRAAADADLNICAYMIIGFPHDTPEHLAENLPFLREMARAGVRDMGAAYYMALPGTELFRSLCERGRIVLDEGYFRQVLEGLSPIPAASYSDALDRPALFYWKVRYVAAFYGARLRQAGLRRLLSSMTRAFGPKSHENKLETAARIALKNGMNNLRVLFGHRWMSRAEERALFAGWDATFQEIWRERRAAGVEPPAPVDSRQLEHQNVNHVIQLDHRRGRVLTLAGRSPPPGDRAPRSA